jgi:hypothetical protein
LHWTVKQEPPNIDQILQGAKVRQLKPILKKALEEQGAIGWQYALRGFLSSHWVTAQTAEHPKSTETGIRQQWAKMVIRQIWELGKKCGTNVIAFCIHQ